MTYVREDRALKTWIVFPSEQARRAYVQASVVVVGLAKTDAARMMRLRLLIQALGGEEKVEEPKG